ncbi:hypothetical protein HDU98_008427 [Podochytrium sp. JEL0797]|nr:hypothetical protein HDU98_008427 [Podochytrium sp. JEL0797]
MTASQNPSDTSVALAGDDSHITNGTKGVPAPRSDSPSPSVDEADMEVLDDEPKSILLALVSQLTIGMDLHRVTLPTFVLETRSMCERITDFMSHPDLLIEIPKLNDPVDRFIAVTRFFLAGWHIRPKGVKKPYNPVLGEFFRCTWTLPDNSTSYYICEQVGHHPPISAYDYINPHHGVYVSGDLRPKAKFLGNSAATLMQGATRVKFAVPESEGGGFEDYIISFPSYYARGILFGKMYTELGDSSTIVCERTGLHANLEWKTRGTFTHKGLNGVEGTIMKEKVASVVHKAGSAPVVVAKVWGKWSDELFVEKLSESEDHHHKLKNHAFKGFLGSKKVAEVSSGDGKSLFNAATAEICPKNVAAESEMETFESRRLWKNVTKAIQHKDLDDATTEKLAIEDHQRIICQRREDAGEEWKPRFYVAEGDDFKLDIEDLSKLDPSAAEEKLAARIFSKAELPMHQNFWA